MARIDPKIQARLNAVIISGAGAFSRLSAEVEEAAMELKDLVLALDKDGNEKAASIATDAIEKARK